MSGTKVRKALLTAYDMCAGDSAPRNAQASRRACLIRRVNGDREHPRKVPANTIYLHVGERARNAKKTGVHITFVR